MKLFGLVILITLIHCTSRGQSMYEIRNEFKKARTDKATCNRLITKLSASKNRQDNLLNAYKASTLMISARFEPNPIDKLNVFLKGKELLENCVAASPNDIEVRFLRFSIQTNAPFFLGYQGHIKNDKNYIITHMNLVSDIQLATLIKEVLIKSNLLTQTEKKQLNL